MRRGERNKVYETYQIFVPSDGESHWHLELLYMCAA